MVGIHFYSFSSQTYKFWGKCPIEKCYRSTPGLLLHICTSDLYPIPELKMFINPLKHFRHLWRNTGLSNLMFISCRKLRKFPAQNICWIRKNIFFILLHFFLSRTVAYTHFMETVKNKFYIQAKLIMNSDFDLLYINEIVVQ